PRPVRGRRRPVERHGAQRVQEKEEGSGSEGPWSERKRWMPRARPCGLSMAPRCAPWRKVSFGRVEESTRWRKKIGRIQDSKGRVGQQVLRAGWRCPSSRIFFGGKGGSRGVLLVRRNTSVDRSIAVPRIESEVGLGAAAGKCRPNPVRRPRVLEVHLTVARNPYSCGAWRAWPGRSKVWPAMLPRCRAVLQKPADLRRGVLRTHG